MFGSPLRLPIDQVRTLGVLSDRRDVLGRDGEGGVLNQTEDNEQGGLGGGFAAESTPAFAQWTAPGQESEDEVPISEVVPEFLRAVEANMSIAGRLTLHFQDRDVHLDVDGYAGLKTVANVASDSSDWNDDIDPAFSDARYGWFSARRERLLAASWQPHPVCTCE